jgi:PAS domain-containing protein
MASAKNGWCLRSTFSLVFPEKNLAVFSSNTGPGQNPRKQFDELTTSEDKYRVMVDAVSVLLWCNLPDGSNEFRNQKWHDYTGLSEEELHAWGWRVTFHPDDQEKLLDTWKGPLFSCEPGEIEARR